MRDIKFRAWDKVKKEMILLDSFYEIQVWNRAWNELNDFELMQYTGLKDKNGKEIYEGDILRERIDLDDGQSCEDVYLVEWLNDAMTCGWNTDYITAESSIVVGNQYENPELSEPLG